MKLERESGLLRMYLGLFITMAVGKKIQKSLFLILKKLGPFIKAVGKMLKVNLCINGFFSHRKPLPVKIIQNIWYLIFLGDFLSKSIYSKKIYIFEQKSKINSHNHCNWYKMA